MKTEKIMFFLLLLLSVSCVSQKNERQVINDFVKEQFNKKPFVSYNNKSNVLINNAGNGLGALLSYEQSYVNTSQLNYNFQKWILDSLDIKKIKKLHQNKEDYYWKNTDFDYNFVITDSETNKKNYESGHYLNTHDEFLVLTISKPIFVSDEYALIWFNAKDKLGSTLNTFTVLMKKEKGNKKWSIDSYYYDVDNIW